MAKLTAGSMLEADRVRGEYRELKSMYRARTGLGIIGAIFIILFVIGFARVLLGSQPLTFTGFLETMSTIPDVVLSTNLIDFSITGSWGIVDFIRVFINLLISFINILAYIGSLLYNLSLTLVWCIRFVLGF